DDGTPSASYADIPFTITLPLVADTFSPRTGFTKIDSAHVAVNVGIQASDLKVCFNCAFTIPLINYYVDLSPTCDSLGNGLIGLVYPLLSGPLETKILGVVQAA